MKIARFRRKARDRGGKHTGSVGKRKTIEHFRDCKQMEEAERTARKLINESGKEKEQKSEVKR